MMETDGSVFLIGQGVKSPWYVGQTCKDLLQMFGPKRVIDTPVSENAVTGAAVGASIAGMKAVVVHPRVDFMLYALDPVINEAANWRYMYGGASSVPVVIWAIINRGGEQGAQHSQSLQALFAHIPGLKVVMPATPYDAKGLMISAINDPNPVVFLDDRWLYGIEGEVPEEIYSVEIGKARIAREGKDITIVASSFLANQAELAAEDLAAAGIDAEVIDLRTIKPLDTEAIIKSVRKTKRLLVVDGGWKSFGVSAEVAAIVSEHAFDSLAGPVLRLALPDTPAPASKVLEKEYYIYKEHIVAKVKEMGVK
jgi:pyruvate dehydrogenase E1 component beta subunit